MNVYRDKVAIVTGGASGIGRAVCFGLGRAGCTVVAADVKLEGAEETAREIVRAGGRAEGVRLDVTRAEAVGELVGGVAGRLGRLDFMFNNAGVVVFGDARDMDLDIWRRHFEVNLHGVAHGTHAAYRVMCGQGFGHIVNTASLAGLVPSPAVVPYTATKFAVVGLSAALRAEGRDLGVRVSVVCPGFIRTGMFECDLLNVDRDAAMTELPMRLIWTPEKAARAILRGVARNREYIVFPWYARLFWWLQRLSPALMQTFGRRMIRDFRRYRSGP